MAGFAGFGDGGFFARGASAYYGEYPLGFAVCTNQPAFVRFLVVECYADISAGDSHGNTAAHLCVYHDRLEMYELLEALWDKGYGRPVQHAQTPLAAVRSSLEEMKKLSEEYRDSIGDPDVNDEDHKAIAADMDRRTVTVIPSRSRSRTCRSQVSWARRPTWANSTSSASSRRRTRSLRSAHTERSNASTAAAGMERGTRAEVGSAFTASAGFAVAKPAVVAQVRYARRLISARFNDVGAAAASRWRCNRQSWMSRSRSSIGSNGRWRTSAHHVAKPVRSLRTALRVSGARPLSVKCSR